MQLKCCLFIFLLSLPAIPFCQSVTDSVPQKDSVVKNLTAKQMKKEKDSITRNLSPIPGKAIVYIVRPTIMGFAVPMRLDCDSFQVGWIGAKSFLYTILDSGEHTFKALSENEFHLKVNLEAGKIYYMEQQVKMGIMYARTKLKLLTDEAGKKELSKCGLSNHNQYPKFPLSKDVESSPPAD
jgi:hypothetical protein